VLLAVIGVFLLYAFFRNPKLLGKDFAPVQKELMKLINKKRKGGKGGKGKRRKRLMQQEADALAANAAQIKQVEE
jgi:hypothetical protein